MSSQPQIRLHSLDSSTNVRHNGICEVHFVCSMYISCFVEREFRVHCASERNPLVTVSSLLLGYLPGPNVYKHGRARTPAKSICIITCVPYCILILLIYYTLACLRFLNLYSFHLLCKCPRKHRPVVCVCRMSFPVAPQLITLCHDHNT